MLYQQAAHKYTSSSHNVNKTKQVVMLYDGIIRFVANAATALQSGDHEARYNNITKAQNIIHGLQVSLDHATGGDIAKLLDDFYTSIFFRLSFVDGRDTEKSTKLLNNIIEELRMMRESWSEVDKHYLASQNDNTTAATQAEIAAAKKDKPEDGSSNLQVSI